MPVQVRQGPVWCVVYALFCSALVYPALTLCPRHDLLVMTCWGVQGVREGYSPA